MKKRINKFEQINDHIPTMITGIDFPHTRNGRGKWLKTGPSPVNTPEFSFARLCFYAQRLREMGMSDADICCMFSNLYWDAFEEFQFNNTYAAHESTSRKP